MSDIQTRYGIFPFDPTTQSTDGWEQDEDGQPGIKDEDIDGDGVFDFTKFVLAYLELQALSTTAFFEESLNSSFSDQFQISILDDVCTVTTAPILNAKGEDKLNPGYEKVVNEKTVYIDGEYRYKSDGSIVTDLNAKHTFRNGDIVYIKPKHARYNTANIDPYAFATGIVDYTSIEETQARMPTFIRNLMSNGAIQYTSGAYSKLSVRNPNDYIKIASKLTSPPTISSSETITVDTIKAFYVVDATATSFKLSEVNLSSMLASITSTLDGHSAVKFYTPGNSLMVSAYGKNIDSQQIVNFIGDATVKATKAAEDMRKMSADLTRFLKFVTDPAQVEKFLADLLTKYGKVIFDAFFKDLANKALKDLLDLLRKFNFAAPGLTGVSIRQMIGVYKAGLDLNTLGGYFKKSILVLRQIQSDFAKVSPVEAQNFEPILLVLEILAGSGQGYRTYNDVIAVIESIKPNLELIGKMSGIWAQPGAIPDLVQSVAGEVMKNIAKMFDELGKELVNQALAIQIFIPTNIAKIIV